MSAIPNNQLPQFISKKNKHLFPEDIRNAFDLVQAKSIAFPSRYLKAQKRLLKREINLLFQTKPKLPLKKALIQLIQPLPNFIPSDLLSELCSFVVDTWNKKLKLQEGLSS